MCVWLYINNQSLIYFYDLYCVFFLFQPDCLDDLAYSIMYEITKLVYRVSEADVIRARNQVALDF